ncbi:hypothetical protein M5K25_021461 [Dendrobium thyrsiflorum]|uniref:Senescence regulator n=1 Tax=Dendrobium thyrsiflorum TaxID=117978 RepID=A0ABD0UCD8_DENTH
MESFRQQRSPGANSFLGLFSQPPPRNGGAAAAATSPTGGGDELDEDDIFWSGIDSSEPNHPSPKHSSSMASPNPNPSPSPSLHRPGHRRFPERNFGILAALPEEDKKRPLLQRKTFSPSSSSAAASPSSPSASARMIPVIPKPKTEYAMSVPGGKIYHQSAPVNVPIVPPRARRGWEDLDGDVREAEDIEEEEMLPPHEIVARAVSKESPLTTFSMLEGVGRTLKGRDLRRVRNAVWHQTGIAIVINNSLDELIL